jgi:glycosyltransferase involved in cell wall biosynthesis
MLSVVIPTKDRRELLLSTLASLESQRSPGLSFEVVVVDNGSVDGTPEAVRARAAVSPMPLTLVTEPAGGPARARNTGVAAASGELIVFIGDDTPAAGDDLLAAHGRLHEKRPDARYAVQGRVTWDDRAPVTPLMEWLERGGVQFGFDDLVSGAVPATKAFCTAHVSVKRELFDLAGGFDQRFPYAAVEDIELGARLEELGVVLDYHPELLALHRHPTDLPASLARRRRVGRSAALLHRIHPDWRRREMGRPRGLRWRLLRLTRPLWSWVERAAGGRPREIAWRALHLSAYAEGYRQGPPSGG